MSTAGTQSDNAFILPTPPLSPPLTPPLPRARPRRRPGQSAMRFFFRLSLALFIAVLISFPGYHFFDGDAGASVFFASSAVSAFAAARTSTARLASAFASATHSDAPPP